MKPHIKVFLLDDEGERFFGEGPFRLLQLIEKTGSLRSASQEMNMAYSKALKIMRHAEEAMGTPLTIRVIGGKNGGGSQLTDKGKELLEQYEAYRTQCIRAGEELFEKFF